MGGKTSADIIEEARAVLDMNDAGTFTRPAPGLYPHQWLWDSAFIAIGIAQYDPHRAAQEIYSLFEGQWSNGMIPHMIFSQSSDDGSSRGHRTGAKFWESHRSPYAPKHKETSGITQPPVVAEACWRIYKKMNKAEGQAFLRNVYPHLLAYHRWLYRERDPDGNGVVALFHPWETGLDNAPAWMEELKRIHTPIWIKLIELFKLDVVFAKLFRRDLAHVDAEERMSTGNALRLTHVALGLRKRNYDTKAIMRRPHFVTESLSFNSILIGNNRILVKIAHELGEKLPEQMINVFKQADLGLNGLWHEESKQFCHRNYLTGENVRVAGIASLLPLYSGALSKARATQLVRSLKNKQGYWLDYPVPTVPKNSRFFNPRKYWQGPTWINTNWLLIQGLTQYGFHKEAADVKKSSIALFKKSGSYEYFSPLDGSGAGTANFSWTAALIIDLVKSRK